MICELTVRVGIAIFFAPVLATLSKKGVFMKVRSLTVFALAFATIGLMLGVQPETAKAQSIADRIKKAVEDAQKKGQPQQKAPQQTPQPNGTPAPAGQQTSAPQASRQNAPNAKASAPNATQSTAKVDAQVILPGIV